MKPINIRRSKADQIRHFLLERIRSREYRDRIPTLQQLACYFDVNIKTVKRAVAELEKAGTLYSHKGRGTFIRRERPAGAPILYIGHAAHEVSQCLAMQLCAAVEPLGVNYRPYALLVPSPTRFGLVRMELPWKKELAGILVEGDLLNSFEEVVEVPVVHLLDNGTEKTPHPVILADNAGGIRQALEHLQSLGHRRVGYLGADGLTGDGRPCEPTGLSKREAFLAIAEELGMVTRPEWNLQAYYRVWAGYRAALELFDRPERPTAVVCINDEVALGVLDACAERKIRVPEELSVIGFDDRPSAVSRPVRLTTVAVDFRRMATEGVKLLDQLIHSPETVTGEPMLLPTRLVVRESTGPAYK